MQQQRQTSDPVMESIAEFARVYLPSGDPGLIFMNHVSKLPNLDSRKLKPYESSDVHIRETGERVLY